MPAITIAVDSSKEIEILDKHVLIRRTVNQERNVLVPDFDRIIDECVRSKASIQTAYIDYLELVKLIIKCLTAVLTF